MSYEITDELRHAVKLFNRWQFEEATKAFTVLSEAAESPEKDFLASISLLASGFFRIWHNGGEPNAMVDYINRGHDELKTHPHGTMGLDLREFDQGVPACIEEARRWRRGESEIFNRDFIPRIEYIPVPDED